MSLLDTINGAREEVANSRKDVEAAANKSAAAKADAEDSSSGMLKRSVSRAKPSRDAAQGVRVAATSAGKRDSARAARSNKKAMTSEQRKAAQAEEDRNRDRMMTASNIMLGKDPVYRKRKNVWWTFVIGGLVMTAISFVMIFIAPPETKNDFTTVYGIVSFVALILAYVGIGGALIYDLVRIRPIRKQMDEKAHTLSYKRLDAIIKEDIVERRVKKGRRRFGKTA